MTLRVQIQRQQPVVLQQHAGFQGSLMSQIEMLTALYCGVGNTVIFASFVTENTEQIACGKQADGAAGDVLFRDHPEFKSTHDMLVCTAAVQITPGFQCLGDGLNRC